LDLLLGTILERKEDSKLKYYSDNASIHCLETNKENKIYVKFYNYIDHLTDWSTG